MKRISFFILSLLACIGMWGQQYETNYFPIMTPETATLGKFGAYPVSHYTGGVDVKIPIYTMESNGIKIPIYLQYDGSGFIPNKDCGKVGHDWTLVAGGVITRTVNCVPDEWKSSAETDDYGLHGHLYALRTYGTRDNDAVRNMESIPGLELSYENAPDIFTFNFGEHRGQFMIAHDGTVKVVGGGAYKVDISGLATQQLRVLLQESKIVITTGDGTKYTFGGTVNELDISLRLPKGADEKEADISYRCVNGVITGFHLSEIETIDGQKIYFSYEESSFKDEASGEAGFDCGPDVIRNAFYSDSKMNVYNGSVEDTYGSIATSLGYSYTHAAVLSSITCENGSAEFIYDIRPNHFAKRNSSGGWNEYNYRLGNIKVMNSQDDVMVGVKLYHSYVQSYDYANNAYTANGCYRMFLDSISINRDVYGFTYNIPNRMPASHTRGVDMQGYYNGYDSNSSLLPGSGSRGSSFTYASYGMLERITYPTGGYTDFTYENHRYGTLLQKPSDGFFMTATTTEGIAGGLRIKQIKNVPGETITYEYLNEDGTSSGVYSNSKQYSFLVSYNDIALGYTTMYYRTSNNLVPGTTFAEQEIVYGRVVETRGSGAGKKVYHYTTYADYPDQTYLGNTLDYLFYSNLTNAQLLQLSGLSAITSLHLERGKLTVLEEYNGSGSLLQKSTYTYSTDDDRMSQAIYSSGVRFSIASSGCTMANTVAHYYYPNQLSKQVVESYDGGTHQSTTEYTYHSGTRELVTETVTNSDGSVHGKKLYYPQDITSNTIYSAMKNKNQLSTVVKEEQLVGSANNVVKTLENEYAAFTGNNTTYYDLATVKQTVGSTTQTLLTISARDSHRNVLEATELGKPTSCYLWGYGYHLPVAKLENVTRGTLSSLISTTIQEAIAASYAPYNSYRSTLEALTTAASAVQVTLYEHEPGAGLVYSKTSGGEKSYYGYDSYGRLTQISKESADEVVQQVEYYANNSLLPLTASPSRTSTTLYTGTRTLGISVTGGSGERTYSLQLKRGTTTLASTVSASLSYDFTSVGTYVLSGWVKDKNTQEVVEFSYTYTVEEAIVLPTVEFTNVEQHVRESYGNYYSTATIECEEAMTVEFSLVPMLESGTFSCTIGENYSLSGSGVENGEEKFTVELDAGTNYVEIRLIDSPNGSVDLFIQEVDGGTVGSNSILTVMAEKAEN